MNEFQTSVFLVFQAVFHEFLNQFLLKTFSRFCKGFLSKNWNRIHNFNKSKLNKLFPQLKLFQHDLIFKMYLKAFTGNGISSSSFDNACMPGANVLVSMLILIPHPKLLSFDLVSNSLALTHIISYIVMTFSISKPQKPVTKLFAFVE